VLRHTKEQPRLVLGGREVLHPQYYKLQYFRRTFNCSQIADFVLDIMTTTNYSFYAIPAVWIISLYPHLYAVSLLVLPTHGQLIYEFQSGIIKKVDRTLWNNHNLRSTTLHEQRQKSMPADVYARYERAEAAHMNGMENVPMFVGAVLAGNIVGLSGRTCITKKPVVSANNGWQVQ
jgi:hypothetical protein